MTIIDSAGTHSPIKMNETIGDKKETEKRLRDIIFLLSDFFILVVNDYTTVDQEILEKLEKQLKGNKNKLNKEIIVVHNLKDIYDENDKNYIWQKQIESLYPQSENKTSKNKNQEEEKNQKNVNQSRHDTEKRALTLIQNVSDFQLSYLKTDNSRHVMMINDNSEYGNKYNNAVIEMISGWMKTCCTRNRKKNIYKKFFKILSRNLNSSQSDSNYPTPFNGQSPLYNYKGLLVFEDRDDNTKLKLFCNDTNITNSISVLPNNYIPPIDILESPTEFIILIDIPGDVEYEIINEKNRVKFILKRSEEYKELFGSRERASGESYQEFKIPAQYNPENPVDTLENGVLKVIFKARQKYGKKGGSAAIKK
jgi:HSP20 family molecular chaperone IbpA